MPRTPQIYTCAGCGAEFNGTMNNTPPGWRWHGNKLTCEDCNGRGRILPTVPASNTGRTFIVVGPQGCGKTTHREEIALRLCGNRQAFVEDWYEGKALTRGHVHLTCSAPGTRWSRKHAGQVRVLQFADIELNPPTGGATEQVAA